MTQPKVRITAEDLDRVDSSASDSASASAPVTDKVRIAYGAPRNHRGLIAAGVAAGMLAVVAVLAIVVSSLQGPSIEAWLRQQRQEIDRSLADSSKAKAYIERIHPLTTYTGGAIKTIQATTIDGSNRPGRNGENVSELSFVITYHWKGPVQQNGYTDVLYVLDARTGQLKKAQFQGTNALINLDDINWFDVGWKLAPLLLSN